MEPRADKPTPCPGCGATMQSLRVAQHVGGNVTVDLCPTCQAFWFDGHESVGLTPGATLALFDAIRKTPTPGPRPLPARLDCPRCAEPLALTHDLQRTTRFLYYRCASGHGRFTPFVQFLREKDFIRAPSPGELARIKASIRIVRCSSCGAPVDLDRDAACPYCRAPIAILDPDAVAANVRALEAAEAKRSTVDVGALVDAMLAVHAHAAQDAIPRRWAVDNAVDLVALGLAAAASLLER